MIFEIVYFLIWPIFFSCTLKWPVTLIHYTINIIQTVGNIIKKVIKNEYLAITLVLQFLCIVMQIDGPNGLFSPMGPWHGSCEEISVHILNSGSCFNGLRGSKSWLMQHWKKPPTWELASDTSLRKSIEKNIMIQRATIQASVPVQISDVDRELTISSSWDFL